ncbi:aspartate carbamoyltransferase [Amycolatopsis sp. NPDC058340]|uniref:aspartate/ornithine carbamoyltransferase family protein n=1 Tax=Amycolatopsis sp. NPDC058340 TaxID=3346453 RepID=UPI00365777C1
MATEIRHFTSVRSMDGKAIRRMFDLAAGIRALPAAQRSTLLHGRVVVSAFYQPSTRTRTAFESAALRLGAACTGFAEASSTRAGDFYQETLEDVVANLGMLGDAVVLRHFESGAAARAALVSPVPVINAGDGYNEHPSQALGDVWTMWQLLGDLAGTSIGLLGNANVRSLHSITFVLAELRPAEVVFLPEPGTSVPEDSRLALEAAGVRWTTVGDVEDLLTRCDLVETIGTRHPDHSTAQQLANAADVSSTPERFRIDAAVLKRVNREVPILHPGPRTDEVATDVDGLPVAHYLPQVRHGMWMKAAMLASCLCAPEQLAVGIR